MKSFIKKFWPLLGFFLGIVLILNSSSVLAQLIPSSWPEEIVPLYPGANPSFGPTKLVSPDGSKTIYQYSLNIDSATASQVYQWHKDQLTTRGFKVTQDTLGATIFQDNQGRLVEVTLSFSGGPEVPGIIGLGLRLEVGKEVANKCPPGDQGQSGETCNNLNKCDIAGGCNPACCATDQDCPNQQSCNIDNGYCRSGKSCDPQTGTQPTATPTPVTDPVAYLKKQIKDLYGITVIDGDRQWAEKELRVLLETLEKLPPEFLRLTLNFSNLHLIFKRTKSSPDPEILASYSPLGNMIELYDSAIDNISLSFPHIIVHEMTHAIQNRGEYSHPMQDPLMKNYMEAVGWQWKKESDGYKKLVYRGQSSSPTQYGSTSPIENMAESAAIYVTNPQQLKNTSPERYDFLKNNLFGGKEY